MGSAPTATPAARIAAALVALSALACGDGGSTLFVDVRSDFAPGVEVDAIRIELAPTTDAPAVRSTEQGVNAMHDLFGGLRAADFDSLDPGQYGVRASLLSGGTLVARAGVLVQVAGNTAVTIVIARSCSGIVCPTLTDAPTETTCFGGTCVTPECAAGTGTECDPPACATDTGCGTPPACTVARCVSGICLFPDDGSCTGMDGGPPPDAGSTPCSGDPECDDSDPCTMDLCEGGECRFPRAVDGTMCGMGGLACCSGACVDTGSSASTCGAECMPCGPNMYCAAGACLCMPGFGDCDGRPETGCEASLGTDEGNCGMCGNACMAASCIAGDCGSCSGASDCDDGLSCTTDTCSGGTCSNTISGGTCLIDAVCRSSGTRNPANDCQVCTPGTSMSAWMNRTGSCGATTMTDGICGGFSDVCDTTGTLTRMTTTNDCLSGACTPSTSVVMVSCSRTTDGLGCPDGTFCNGDETCGGGTCAPGTARCGAELCDEGGDRCLTCGASGEQCCPGRLVDDLTRHVCCGPDPGIVRDCCAHSDCPSSFCGGSGDRWECVGGVCCFGPCDGSC